MTFDPIGIIYTPFEDPQATPRYPRMAAGAQGTIELLPQYTDGLKDLDGFERIWVVFQFHKSTGSQLLVRPPFDPDNTHGVFATRSPNRPNPIGISCVRLVRVQGNMLCVADVDMLNGTPILDIKPYVPITDFFEVSRIGWFTGKGEWPPVEDDANSQG